MVHTFSRSFPLLTDRIAQEQEVHPIVPMHTPSTTCQDIYELGKNV